MTVLSQDSRRVCFRVTSNLSSLQRHYCSLLLDRLIKTRKQTINPYDSAGKFLLTIYVVLQANPPHRVVHAVAALNSLGHTRPVTQILHNCCTAGTVQYIWPVCATSGQRLQLCDPAGATALSPALQPCVLVQRFSRLLCSQCCLLAAELCSALALLEELSSRAVVSTA